MKVRHSYRAFYKKSTIEFHYLFFLNLFKENRHKKVSKRGQMHRQKPIDINFRIINFIGRIATPPLN